MRAHVPVGAISVRDVDNDELARDVMHATIAAARLVKGNLPRAQAPFLCWQFLRYVIAYDAEMGDQYIRMPWRTLSDGVADCKSQTVFLAAICARCGCDVSIRFAQMPGTDAYGHVYAIVDGVVFDPLLEVGDEVPYIAAHTVNVPSS